jgi:hypothetical protein
VISRHRCLGGIGVLEITLGLAVLVGVDGRLAAALAQDEIFITNNNPISFFDDSVTVYERAAGGNTAPIRTLTGPGTGLNGPAGLVVDPVNNELVVANNRNNSITVYERAAGGNTAPLRTLQGLATELSGSEFLAVTVALPTPPKPIPTLSHWGAITMAAVIALSMVLAFCRHTK